MKGGNMGAKVIQVIVTDMALRGKGEDDDPVRRVIQYWTLGGDFLAEIDPVKTDFQWFNPLTERFGLELVCDVYGPTPPDDPDSSYGKWV